MLPFIQIGPLALSTPVLLTLIGLWFSTLLIERHGDRLGMRGATVSTCVMLGLLGGLLGARIGYALRHLSAYAADPLALLALSNTSFAPWAGALAGALAAGLYGRWRGLPLRPALDALAPGLALMLATLHLAQLASGYGFGAPSELPWHIYLRDEYRHPTQVYELLAALALLALWWWAQRRRAFPGLAFLLVLGLSAAARVFFEAFRGDSYLVLGGLRAAQLIGLLILALCLWLLPRWAQAPNKPDEYAEAPLT